MSDRKRHTLAITFGTNSGVESTVALLQAELPRLEEQRRLLEQELAAVTDRLDAARAALGGLQALAAAPLLQEAAAEVAPAAEQAPEATVPAAAEEPAKTQRRTTKSTPRPAANTPPAERTAAARKAVTSKTAVVKAGKAGTPSAKTRRPASSSAKPRKGAAAPAKPAVATETATAAKASVAPAAVEWVEPVASTEVAEPKKPASGLAESILAHLAGADGPARAGEIAKALGRDSTPGSVNAVRTALERLVKASKAQRSGRGLYLALPR